MNPIKKAREYERDMREYKRLQAKKEKGKLTKDEDGIYHQLSMKIRWTGLAACTGQMNSLGLPDGDKAKKLFPDLDTEEKLDEMLISYDEAIKNKWDALGKSIGMEKMMQIYHRIVGTKDEKTGV
jgi:hypothetical protein